MSTCEFHWDPAKPIGPSSPTGSGWSFGPNWICRTHGNVFYDHTDPAFDQHPPTPHQCEQVTMATDAMARARACAVARRNKWWRRLGRWAARTWDALLERLHSGDYDHERDWE